MSATLMIAVGGKVLVREPLTVENVQRVEQALRTYLPEMARRQVALTCAVEKDGVVHVVQARKGT